MAKPGKKAVPVSERFWPKVDKNGPVPAHCPELGPCWMWLAQLSHEGYGKIERGSKSDGTKRPWLAHRVSYELEHGSCPDDRQVNHGCDNRRCVNPAHLHLGDHQSNAREMVERGRHKPTGFKGSRCGQAKLNEAKVIAARAAHAAGEKIKVLARQYGVSQRAMQFALSGRNWGHV
jgi:hypothetical protein